MILRLGQAITGDANLDGKVDVTDLYYVATNYDPGHTGSTNKVWTDGNFDNTTSGSVGRVDVHDLDILILHWQEGVSSGSMSIEDALALFGL